MSTEISIVDKIDMLERCMVDKFPVIECPVTHRFLDGIYIREIFMPKGSLVSSKIHRTRHPYVIREGVVSVWVNGGKEIVLSEGYEGITEPGTKRILYCHTDVIWTTLHLNPDNEDLEAIEERIIEKHINPYLENMSSQLNLTQ